MPNPTIYLATATKTDIRRFIYTLLRVREFT